MELRRGTLVSFDVATYLATIRFDEALYSHQTLVPVASHLLPWMLAVGTLVGVLVFDEHIVDGRVVVASYGIVPLRPAARVYNSANISVADATVTALTFDSERFDTDTIHDTGSNTSRLTCKTAGKYQISGSLEYPSNAVGLRAASIRLNGATFLAGHTVPAVNGATTQLPTSLLYSLAVNDYVELIAYQTSGGALNVNASGNYSPEFAMVWVG